MSIGRLCVFVFIALCLSSLFSACSTMTAAEFDPHRFSENQVLMSDRPYSLPGKCYGKSKKGDTTVWLEILCQKQITKSLIMQVQADLVRIGYEVADQEKLDLSFGATTAKAVKEFQERESLLPCYLDWATINRLKHAKVRM